ncbi:hypothetical protein KAR91_63005 [Candidatus Pacearchaeota archaeon]|nr:hypothetical protein [Candidatus Pacearchaeota archaeon]
MMVDILNSKVIVGGLMGNDSRRVFWAEDFNKEVISNERGNDVAIMEEAIKYFIDLLDKVTAD